MIGFHLKYALQCPCMKRFRSSKDFPDTHSLITHSYNYDNDDLRVDHLGLHKALCVLMGWNYSRPPDNSRAYQFLSADEAAANQDDLILWPPMVIIHNTLTGKNKEGRMEGLGNKLMDARIRGIMCTFILFLKRQTVLAEGLSSKQESIIASENS